MESKEFKYIKDEEGRFYPVSPEFWELYTDRLAPGTYEITVKEWRSTRSLRQNRTFHGPVLDQLCETTGYEREEMKWELKRMFAPTKVYINMDGEVEEIPKKTSKMTVAEFAEFLEKIIRWTASTFGFVIKIDEDLRDPTLPN